jgi:hypothetical protein
MKSTVSNQTKAVKSVTARPEPVMLKGKKQIIISLTDKQYNEVIELCRPYRVTPEEVALSGFISMLHSQEDCWHGILEDDAEIQKTGIHPGWKHVAEELKKRNAKSSAA